MRRALAVLLILSITSIGVAQEIEHGIVPVDGGGAAATVAIKTDSFMQGFKAPFTGRFWTGFLGEGGALSPLNPSAWQSAPKKTAGILLSEVAAGGIIYAATDSSSKSSKKAIKLDPATGKPLSEESQMKENSAKAGQGQVNDNESGITVQINNVGDGDINVNGLTEN